jgi:GNAT superfamily N-acetyltransferase
MNGTLILREARPADYAAWLPLWHGYLAFYKIELPVCTTYTTWERLLDPDEPMHLRLAQLDGRVVGLVHFIEHRSTGSPYNVIYLQDLYTAPDARGQGVGRALIEHVFAYAQGIHASKVHWLTHEDNTTARRLYDTVAELSPFRQYRKLF